ncbi:SH3 domain-containing protein [Leptospira kanakyensis]|uniref:SH3 domain-containing protein n=1 Tax=Leptospira kanakyensis TaxID=2484968 RepID=A0A6N4PSQ5_9LEPT|nr:SH3 domain-containing protein [Leptospira kanakyensis]MCW7469940.1 SH3 domain-containing protein [Leptospira kanakyensis]TGK47720.1 SH3 domain-containing protein [Leptospira kanakyensis]TGK63278.1 SH3 domain-containing protein [Leptospira kanakyensis]TGK66884.1 SH3 domain-containing protein [Leptospira kanakyensis]
MKNHFICLFLMIIIQLEAKDGYLPVAASIVNVRKEPSLNSPVISQLTIGNLVKIIPNKKVKDTVNSVNGFWVNVEIGYSSKSKLKDGWIFDNYLGTPEKFTKPTYWLHKKFNGCSGDYCLTLKMKPNATYTYSYELCTGGNCNEETSCYEKSEKKISNNGYILCEGSGVIKVYKNLVWLQKFGKETNEYIFLKEHKLCMPGMDECMD